MGASFIIILLSNGSYWSTEKSPILYHRMNPSRICSGHDYKTIVSCLELYDRFIGMVEYCCCLLTVFMIICCG